jgi:hypothetical protein
MPVRRRIDKRRADIDDEQAAWLEGDDKGAGFFKFIPDDELKVFWAVHSERIVAEHVTNNPGTRPTRWWEYSAPRIALGTFRGCYFDGVLPEPRKRLGGIGTPASDVLGVVPTFSFGLPSVWISQWQVNYYSGIAVDIHGNPIGDRCPKHFKGVAIDPNDPPTFESQAAYLKRHGLLMPHEDRRSDFGPEEICSQ